MIQAIIIQFSINVIDFININITQLVLKLHSPTSNCSQFQNKRTMIIIQPSQQYSVTHHIPSPFPSPSHSHSHSHNNIHSHSHISLLPPPQKYILNYLIQFDNVLGKGNFSTVYRCINMNTNINTNNNNNMKNNNQNDKIMACKLINMAVLRQQKIQHLVHAEIQILKFTNHQNVISCKDVYYTQDWCYIFSQYYTGGTLADFITKNYNYSTGLVPKQTHEILNIIKDIFNGLLYLQKSRIIHRDIKPANIFLKTPHNKAVIADLGFSRSYSEPFYDLQMGSPPYMAPQALMKSYYNNKTDVWAFGVMLYEIFHGEGPYHKAVDIHNLIQKMLVPLGIGCFRYDLSVEMKQLILGCLQPDHQKRLKFSQIQQTWYFKAIFNKNQNLSSTINLTSTTPTTPIKAPLTQRLPRNLNNLNNESNNNNNNNNNLIALLSPKFVQSGILNKSPSFSKINKIKSDIKKRREQSVTVTTFNSGEFNKTPEKFQEKQNQKKIGKMGIKICKQFYSYIKKSEIKLDSKDHLENMKKSKDAYDQNPQNIETILSKISAFPDSQSVQNEPQQQYKLEYLVQLDKPNKRPRAITTTSTLTPTPQQKQQQQNSQQSYETQKQNVYKQWIQRKQFKNDDYGQKYNKKQKQGVDRYFSKNSGKNHGLNMLGHDKIFQKLKIRKQIKDHNNKLV